MFIQLFRWIFCPQTGMDVDAEPRSGEPHSHLAEKHGPLHRWQNFALFCTVFSTGGRILYLFALFLHCPLHRWQNFAFFALFFAPSSAQIAIFFIFPELCIFFFSGVARGGAAHWDFLWQVLHTWHSNYDKHSEITWIFETQRYLASNNANEKNNILGALSCTGEVWLLQKYLDMSIK